MAIKVFCKAIVGDKENTRELYFRDRKEMSKQLVGPSINGETIYNLLKKGKDEVQFEDGTQRILTMEEVL